MDKDGRKLYFAEGTSDEFKERVRQTIEFMNKCGTSYNIYNIEQSDTVYYIAERTNKSSGFNYESKTIFWNSHAVAKGTTGILRSPTTSLAHEFGHVNQFEKTLHNGTLDEFYDSLEKVDGNAYGSIEEARNIETTEQYAARRHGEIREDTITRFDHESTEFEEIDAYSMTPEELSKHLFNRYNYQAL